MSSGLESDMLACPRAAMLSHTGPMPPASMSSNDRTKRQTRTPYTWVVGWVKKNAEEWSSPAAQ